MPAETIAKTVFKSFEYFVYHFVIKMGKFVEVNILEG